MKVQYSIVPNYTEFNLNTGHERVPTQDLYHRIFGRDTEAKIRSLITACLGNASGIPFYVRLGERVKTRTRQPCPRKAYTLSCDAHNFVNYDNECSLMRLSNGKIRGPVHPEASLNSWPGSSRRLQEMEGGGARRGGKAVSWLLSLVRWLSSVDTGPTLYNLEQ